jgi:GntR family transcriptional regulator
MRNEGIRNDAVRHRSTAGDDGVSLLGAVARALDRTARTGLPKYLAVRDAVIDAVSAGAMPPGARLPAETEWTVALGVSLGTVQRALRLLVDDGVLMRRQGQGSFVAEQSKAMESPLHCRFINDTGDGYLPVFTHVVERYDAALGGPWSAHLRADAPYCIDRVLDIGGEFRVFSRFVLDPTRLPLFKTLTIKQLDGENFKRIILRTTGMPIGKVSQRLSSVKLAGAIARAIRVKPGTFGSLIEAEAFIGNESPIYYQEIYIPPNTRKLHLARDGRDAGLLG